MGRKPRYVPAGGALVEVTTRTVQGRFLLKPTPTFTRRFLGVIGRAQERYGVEIHIFAALANHYHLLLSVRNAHQLSKFMQYVNSNVAREAGRLFDWNDAFWGRRYTSILTSQEPAAQLDRFRYILAQGVKEGLVDRVRDWPGPTCAGAWLDGDRLEGEWIDWTGFYERCRRRKDAPSPDQFAQPVSVALSPLPCWKHLTDEEIRRQVAQMAREIEAEARATGRPPLGRDRLLKVHPHERPRRLERRPATLCHAASREIRDQIREAFRIFVQAFNHASRAFRRGEPDALQWFPEGSFVPAIPYRPEASPG